MSKIVGRHFCLLTSAVSVALLARLIFHGGNGSVVVSLNARAGVAPFFWVDVE